MRGMWDGTSSSKAVMGVESEREGGGVRVRERGVELGWDGQDRTGRWRKL